MPTLDRVVCLVEDQVPYWKVFSVAEQVRGSVHVCLIFLPVVAVTTPRMSVWLVQVGRCVQICSLVIDMYMPIYLVFCLLNFVCTVNIELL